MRNQLFAALAAPVVIGVMLFGVRPSAQQGAPNVPKPIEPPAPFVPEGFTAIFNGRDLTGWHVSTTNHHGTTPAYRVMHGMIVGTQNPFGQGGILLTDKKYRNVEL